MTEQQLSFEDLDAEAFDAVSAVADDTRGWRGPAACAVVGITYRQLDYWARSELAQPASWPSHLSPPRLDPEKQPPVSANPAPSTTNSQNHATRSPAACRTTAAGTPSPAVISNPLEPSVRRLRLPG
ncbi:hypothetical protein [Mycolicibacterium cosmeticum]|uniref:hypothetical protein n=1 Tax=Mycolicibacterium cosmeticum TaxID=258533 RepID=UPI003D161D42